MKAELIRDVLSRCRGSFVAVTVFSMIINILMLVAPLYVLQVFDRVLSSESRETLLYLTLFAAVAFVTLGVLEAVRGHVLVRLSNWIEQRLSGQVLQNGIRTALRDQGANSVQGLRDLAVCTNFMSGPAILSILDVPWTPIFVIVIFMLHPMLGWLSVIGVGLLVALILINEFATRGPLNLSSGKSMRLLSSAETSVRNADAVEGMGMMGNLLKRWNKANDEALDLREKASVRAGNIKAVTRAVRMFLQVAILGLGAWLVLELELTPGAMIAGSILFGRAMSPIDQAMGSWRSAIAARESYARLKHSMADVPLGKVTFPLPAPSGHLNVDGVSYIYPGDREPTLRHVSFALQPGEILAIVGPTAAGKSTLARLLIGNIAPLSGRVSLDNADVSTWESEDLGQYIGYLPQDVELFDGTVHANIARMGEEDGTGVIEAARLAEVHDVILGLKDAYMTEIGKRGGALSGGQSQRIGLARALYGQPKLVVLDEPNANLDQQGENALGRVLTQLRERKMTTVVITHRLWILRNVDKILVLRDGAVEMFGPRDEVMAKIARPVPARPADSVVVGSSHG